MRVTAAVSKGAAVFVTPYGVAGAPSAFSSLYVASEILMLSTPDPIRTAAHHTSRLREVGVALNEPECQSVSLPWAANCRHAARSPDGRAMLSSIPGIVVREAGAGLT